MIIGRLEDYIERIKRELRVWQRQDANLHISTQGQSIFMTALYESMELSGQPIEGHEQSYEEYPDAVFIDLQQRVRDRDPQLKRKIL